MWKGAWAGMANTDPQAKWLYQGWAIRGWNDAAGASRLKALYEAVPQGQWIPLDMDIGGIWRYVLTHSTLGKRQMSGDICTQHTAMRQLHTTAFNIHAQHIHAQHIVTRRITTLYMDTLHTAWLSAAAITPNLNTRNQVFRKLFILWSAVYLDHSKLYS